MKHPTWNRFIALVIVSYVAGSGATAQMLGDTSITLATEQEASASAASVSDEQRLRELQQRIEQMQKQIEQLQRALEEARSQIMELSQKVAPAAAANPAGGPHFRPSNYVQFQWVDSQEPSAGREGFQVRRFRIGQTNVIDPRLRMRLTFDVATGPQRIDAELRDAQLIWDIQPATKGVGVQLFAGQQLLPFSAELERPAPEREMPERALYLRTMFGGERGRGVYVRVGLNSHSFVHFGLWNSLAFQDPQQTDANAFGNLGSQMAYHIGWRYFTHAFEVGVAGFFGSRPGFTFAATDPSQNLTVLSNQRRFIFIDAALIDALPNLTLRGEVMFGYDRVPTGGTTAPRFRHATNLLGYQIQATYRLNERNFFTVRHDLFDPDTSRSRRSDSIKAWGFAYHHFLHPNVRLTVAYEMPDEEGTELLNNAWTVRLQYRY